eukprot:TRINITY_DN5472_c0_g1_i2.p3 TRINITY_DN5472_c0_g1~~TRINITY_DN5472_c0_g1_i2.p3  ORF type:complete len:135 (+),score=9.14 TRINITY_DN5472_c0_g1_i2:120-524(+)
MRPGTALLALLALPTTTCLTYFTQTVCTTATCDGTCLNHSIAMNSCQDIPSGGSMVVDSCSTEIVFKEYPTAGCEGTAFATTMPVGRCILSSNGLYFMNSCPDGHGRDGNVAVRNNSTDPRTRHTHEKEDRNIS